MLHAALVRGLSYALALCSDHTLNSPNNRCKTSCMETNEVEGILISPKRSPAPRVLSIMSSRDMGNRLLLVGVKPRERTDGGFTSTSWWLPPPQLLCILAIIALLHK